jgi:hypothetical protein
LNSSCGAAQNKSNYLKILKVWDSKMNIQIRSRFFLSSIPKVQDLHKRVFSLLSLLWKNKSTLIRSPCCLCVCMYIPPTPTFEYLNQSLWKLVCTSWYLSSSK